MLTLRGARVIGTARTLGRAREACDEAAGLAVPLACELADPTSVRACAAAVRRTGCRLDAIICNAGIMALPRLQLVHGYELQFFANHIGHFMLVTGLLDELADCGRVVMLSSVAHRIAPREGIDFGNLSGATGYSPWTSYGRAKLANLLFARELARRFDGTSRTANAVHPGIISTGLARNNPMAAVMYALTGPLVQKSIPQGAATEVFVAVHPAASALSGRYFADVNVGRPSAHAEDASLAARLWEVSEQIVAGLPADPSTPVQAVD